MDLKKAATEFGVKLVKDKLEAKGVVLERCGSNANRNVLIIKSFKKKETIRVLTRSRPALKNGKPQHYINWGMKSSVQDDYIALVDMERTRAWLFTLMEFKNFCQQYSGGTFRFRMLLAFTEKTVDRTCLDESFNRYLI